MRQTAAYFELTNLQGLYSQYISTGNYDKVSGLFAKDARLDVTGHGAMEGRASIHDYFTRRGQEMRARGTLEFFSVFGQLSEVRGDENEARCLWMYFSLIPDPAKGTAEYRIGRIDQLCVKEDGRFLIQEQREFVRTQMEPPELSWAAACGAEFYVPEQDVQKMFDSCDNDPETGEMLDILNTHSRYEQYLHCGDWDMISGIFSWKDDSTWAVGASRKRYLAGHPDYEKEDDGPGNSDEPTYWMGANVGHESIIWDGFAGMTIPFSPENQGIYCCSDMLLPLVCINRETGRAYTSVPSYGGFIMGPAMQLEAPYPALNSLGRWLIEWVKEDGEWKMYHFFWSTFYEIVADRYDPAHRADWLSTHLDIHDWPPLPEPYQQDGV